MEKWEYKTVPFKADKGFFGGKIDEESLTETLNVHGKEGWEAVSCFETDYGGGGSRNVYVLMKRRLTQ